MNTSLEALNKIEECLPPVVFRNWHKWRDFLPISPRTLANLDAQGKGVPERILVGNVIGYPRGALVAWLKARSKTVRGRDDE